MRSTPALLLVAAALAAPVTGTAQTTPSGGAPAAFAALEAREQRRLDFYAEKILSDIAAIAQASRSADLAAFNARGHAMKSTIERFIDAAAQYGLSRRDAEELFQLHLAQETGLDLPFFLADDTGATDLERLMALSVSEVEPGQDAGDYFDAIRNAGQAQFGN